MHAPWVSIVTPSFNQGRFLRRTIESVLGQDYPRIDYRVIDGGSSDDSVAILRSYGRGVAWVSEADAGQSDAINKGFTAARGEICAYLNSDDVLQPGAVSTVVAHFRAHADWDCIYGNAHHIDAEDRFIEAYPTAPYSFARLLESCCICQPAAFWRRSIAERVGTFNAERHFAMDYDYWMRIHRAGGVIVHVPEVLACSRLYPETKTLSARLEVYREILEVSVEHAGTASFSQCLAYWQHRCHERPDGWPRHLRRLPDCAWWLALLHTRWLRQHGRTAAVAADLLRSAARRMAFSRGASARRAGSITSES